MRNFKYPAGISLPLVISHENKFVMAILLAVLAAFLYLTSNHFHLSPPQYLEISRLDAMIPFIPITVWVYLSEYVFFVVIFLLCKDRVNLNRYFYSFLFVQCISVVIFWVWPTIYPRELFPIPADTDVFTSYIFQSLRETDTAANCCPSLHVSCVYLSVFIFLNEQRNKFILFMAWGTMIAFSTLTTKQHYAVDIFAGLIMALFAYGVFRFCFNYRTVIRKK